MLNTNDIFFYATHATNGKIENIKNPPLIMAIIGKLSANVFTIGP